MDQWKILVLGSLRLGLNTDYDRIHDLANYHDLIRQMLGHGREAFGEGKDENPTEYSLQSIKDNLALFTPEILDQINQIVIRAGHTLVKKAQKMGKLRSCVGVATLLYWRPTCTFQPIPTSFMMRCAR